MCGSGGCGYVVRVVRLPRRLGRVPRRLGLPRRQGSGDASGVAVLREGRGVPIGIRVAEEWGRLNATRTRNTVDSLIAASARVHGLTVVTRNTADFEGCGVSVLNPWRHQPDNSS